ncbi:MAG: thioesterase family protein [Candidatus Elarobacter sp.]
MLTVLQEFRYKLDIRVTFRDIDFYRHVNNAVYITWMETARIDYCAVAFGRPLGAPTNVIMASQSFDYERQAQYDERLVMGCRCSRLGNKSMELTYELWRGEERVGGGRSALVAFDYGENRSIQVPDVWRERIAAYEIVPPANGR